MTDAQAVGTVIASLGFVGGVLARGLPFFSNGKGSEAATLKQIAESVAGIPDFVKDYREFVVAITRQLDAMDRSISDNGREIMRAQQLLERHDSWERMLYAKGRRPDEG